MVISQPHLKNPKNRLLTFSRRQSDGTQNPRVRNPLPKRIPTARGTKTPSTLKANFFEYPGIQEAPQSLQRAVQHQKVSGAAPKPRHQKSPQKAQQPLQALQLLLLPDGHLEGLREVSLQEPAQDNQKNQPLLLHLSDFE